MDKPKVYIINLTKDDERRKELINFNEKNKIFNFVDRIEEIKKILPSKKDVDIIKTIQELGMKDIDVVISLVGAKKSSKTEPYYDWELASVLACSEKKVGLLVIVLPSAIGTENVTSQDSEDTILHHWEHRDEVEHKWNKFSMRYPSMSSRIIDNIIHDDVNFDVIRWKRVIDNPTKLKDLLNLAVEYALDNKYDVTRPLIHRTLLK